jgi:2-polyprenyl-3-methyl-5-hydroxy-6-metoxy-1,4-benzoquinol methylase
MMGMRGTDPPELVLVQASSRSWAGDEDYCLRELEGAPLVAHTIRAAQRCFPETPVRILAPAFDRGGRIDEIAQSAEGEVGVLYGFDASPLDRMLMAVEGLPAEAYVMRVDGMHFSADFDLAAAMLERARERELDGIKTPDDFPAHLSVDVFRTGALRRARAVVDTDDSPFLVHPKFLLPSLPGFRFERYEDVPAYTEAQLWDTRNRTTEILSDAERQEIGRDERISQGDQLGYHYELALRYIHPGDRVLDVACGVGFGVRMMTVYGARVTGVDRDEESILCARAVRADGGGDYVVADATRMPFEDGAFNVVVSFETIEHVPAQPFLAEIDRVLAKGGVLLLSTPQNRLGHVPFLPSHNREFSLDELTEAMEQRFDILDRIGLKAGTIWFEGDPVGSNSFFVCRRR